VTTPFVLTLLGFGIGVLLVVDRRTDPRALTTLREHAIEAQKISARASQRARALTAKWSEEDALKRGVPRTEIL
jgi:hypothetical protein